MLKTKTSTLVIDCGSTKRYIQESFSQIDLQLSAVDALLLTHDHSDHISQIKLFKDKSIYAPFNISEPLHSTRVVPYQSFRIKDIEITPIPLSHDTDINVGYVLQDTHQKLVYITDTGYIRQNDYPMLRDANYYIIESNHDPETLMKTNRPFYLKQRILSDNGHLSNEDSLNALKHLVSQNTHDVVFAHISEEANSTELLLKQAGAFFDDNFSTIRYRAASQFSIMQGGFDD